LRRWHISSLFFRFFFLFLTFGFDYFDFKVAK
jgi:hypothetical protein